ncbi:DEAD/DEAH box helicase [Fibrella aquatilis]|uniref:DNA 3'-5' helicase n=1 Tax=Fibrella aquatilis TaxID=2817059 RepID=A0A939G7H4_9BACT|nr:DEAD/DEAH box helicase [Fibrella aquatilis]MBO0932435.1 DEAD/DEAH box helicase [Fibrella aquatilis]
MSAKAFTASYNRTNPNFIIQNLPSNYVTDVFTPTICVLKNLLQRGKPTGLSQFLEGRLGSDAQDQNQFALIDSDLPNWERTIRGDEKNDFYPARDFYETIIPGYLPEYAFIRSLILPEAFISDIIPESDTDKFTQQQVDFYLPQAFVVIEIDGSQHKESAQQWDDQQRDTYLQAHGVKVIRFVVADLLAKNEAFAKSISDLCQRLAEHESRLRQYRLNAAMPLTEQPKRKLQLAAIMRFQLLMLELLHRGEIRLTDKQWRFNLREHDATDFAKLALDDLFIWFGHLLKLQAPHKVGKTYKLRFDPELRPAYIINPVAIREAFPADNGINIDFSVLKRWTDEADTNSNTLFVRTDYIDEYHAVIGKQLSCPLLTNHFRVSTASPVQYHIVYEGKHKNENSLDFFLKNLFDYPKFRSGQLGIIANALNLRTTIGLLPTGSGKSICFQLPALLQPALSFVVCPIKALMRDQAQDLQKAGINQIAYINSELSATEKARAQQQFGEGRYFFVFVSPERFQSQTFRDALTAAYAENPIAYGVIDEAHCLSEWGHDFRTSYLNLIKTIKSHCPAATLVGLTATASLNVLKDLKAEMGVDDSNDVKTLPDYGREELTFEVIDDGGKKLDYLTKRLKLYQGKSLGNSQRETAGELSDKFGCGLIFTPNVNGGKGCYSVANSLATTLNETVKWYAGSIPTITSYSKNSEGQSKKEVRGIMAESEFDIYKQNVQDEYKKNGFSLMVATKAFGMGINKPNIRITAHYGLPASMESLYQEAGRAGRDKGDANCLIFLTKERYPDVISTILSKDTFLEDIKSACDNLGPEEQFDVFSQLFLLTNGLGTVLDDVKDLKELTLKLIDNQDKGSIVIRVDGETNAGKTEKAIYRLMLLGLVEDWTVTWKFPGRTFKVILKPEWNAEYCQKALMEHIVKYEPDFQLNQFAKQYPAYFANYDADKFNQKVLKLYMKVLVVWTYVSIVANRKQSLKTVYENCLKEVEGHYKPGEFKRALEDYFKFDDVSYVLQGISEQTLIDLTVKQIQSWFYNFFRFTAPARSSLSTDKTRSLIPTDEVEFGKSRFILTDEIKTMQAQLSRVLEARGNNTGLNMMSGLVRALNDDYEDNDGRVRFEEALSALKQTNIVNTFFIGCQRVASHIANREGRYEIAQSILRVFPDQQKHIEQWADSLQLPELLFTDYRQRLNQIKRLNRQLHEQTTRVR